MARKTKTASGKTASGTKSAPESAPKKNGAGVKSRAKKTDAKQSEPKSAPTATSVRESQSAASKKRNENRPTLDGEIHVAVERADGTVALIARPTEPHQFGRGGGVRNSDYAAAADRASQYVCTDGNGAPLNRARIGTNQIAALSAWLGKRDAATVATRLVHGDGKLAGGKSAAIKSARQYGNGETANRDLPDGARDRIRAAAAEMPWTLTKDGSLGSAGDVVTNAAAAHKLSGRAFIGALFGIADSKS
jgi:hypothetical protein